MWAGHFWCFGFLLFLFVMGYFLMQSLRFRRYTQDSHRSIDEVVAILQKRLASGEIDEAEYQKLKDVLRK